MSRSTKNYYKTDRDFQHLAELVDFRLQQNNVKHGKGMTKKEKDSEQEKQVNAVFKLENSFKTSLMPYERLTDIYQDFINYIKKDVGNILVSQSYFREKKTTFNKNISSCIKNDNPKGLMEFHINYNLISFIVERWGGPLPDRAAEIYEKFIYQRQVLIENNIPLAINRAKLFFRQTSENNLSLLDLVNICVSGLVVGIDKYAGPYTKVWRSVCIGRMVGFMIKEYSETFVKLYPNDKKILYRANVIKYRKRIEDLKELTKAVNESFRQDKLKGMSIPKLPISEVTIKSLMNAAHYVSTDSKVDESNEQDDNGVGIYDYTSDSEPYVEINEDFENKDSLNKLSLAILELDMIPRKVIRLKGVTV